MLGRDLPTTAIMLSSHACAPLPFPPLPPRPHHFRIRSCVSVKCASRYYLQYLLLICTFVCRTYVYTELYLILRRLYGHFTYICEKPCTWGHLSWGWPPTLQSHLGFVYRSIDGKMVLVSRKLSLIHWQSTEIHVMDTERRARVWLSFAIFEL